ncbi:MAG: hypothetical protein AAGF96_05875 [Bacteroidota bacterium]
MKKLLVILFFLGVFVNAQKPTTQVVDFIPIAVPAQSEGRLYYDQTSQTLFLWNGSSWVDLGGSGGGSEDGVVSGVSLSGQNLNFTGTAPGFIGAVDLSSLVSPYVPLSGATMNSGSTFIAYNFGVRNLQSGGPAAEFYQTDASDNTLSSHIFDRGQIYMSVKNDGVSPTQQMDLGINAESDYSGYYIGMSGSANTAKILKFLNISGSSVGQRTAEFTGRVAGEDGIALDEFATKGQLDALAANGTGIVAEGTITTDGSGTTYTANHGLGYAPASTRIQTQRLDDGTTGAESEISIGNITTTSFDIIIESASATGDPIAWRVYGTDSATPWNGDELVTAIDTELGGTTWQSGGGATQKKNILPLTQDTTLTATAFDSGALWLENTSGNTYDVTIDDDGIEKGEAVTFNQIGQGKIRVKYDAGNALPGILASTIDSISAFTIVKQTTSFIPWGAWESFSLTTPPPLDGNPNPELNNSNASGFGSENANNLWPGGGADGEYQIIGDITLNTVADVTHGYGGTHVLEIVDGAGDGGDYPRVWQAATTGEVYEWAVLYYNFDCDDAVFQIDGGGSADGKEVDLTVQGAWTLVTGEFTQDDTLFNWRVFPNKNGTGQIGDRIHILVSIKLKDDQGS